MSGRSGAAGSAGAGAGAIEPTPPVHDDIPAADSFPRLEAAMFGTPKLLSAAFDLAEGPVWDHCEQRLLFTDVNRRKLHSLVPGGEVEVYFEKSNYVNGMVFDPQGRLLMAEMGGGEGGRITRMRRDKTLEVLIDRSPSGARLHTSDDLALHPDGTIYFSDPAISHGPYVALSLASAPIYQLKPGEPNMRELSRVGDGRGTNGIRLTRDYKTLLVSEYSADKIAKYTLQPDGTLKAAGDFATGLSKSDSMCLDVAGNVYIGVETGLQVLRPDGSKVALLRVGSETTNCAFGGPDGKTLFITAWTKLLQLDGMPIPGLAWHQDKHMQCDPAAP